MLLQALAFHSSTATLTLSSDSCGDPGNCRTFLDIVWGCLTTIFACTWISVHPNVPAQGQTWVKLTCRRLGMMLMAIVAPELIVFLAARQFFFAGDFSKRFGVPRTHGFFFAMGGFVSGTGTPVTTFKQLEDPLLGAQYLAEIRATDVASIMDRSKGDALSKGVALIQSAWFMTQCIARLFQRLPVTELEVATLAFAAVNIFTWLLWWGKPLDAQTPIRVGPVEDENDIDPTIYLKTPSSIWSVMDAAYGAIYGGDYHPRSSTPVPLLWCPHVPHRFLHAFLLETSSAIIFGAIHCSAWAVVFPSAAEKWIWRASSLLVTAIPAAMGLVQLISPPVEHSPFLTIPFAATLCLYIVSRLGLIILPFTTLRILPPGAFMDIDWTTFIPHV
ncbi:hypothetical protein DFH07DRAFT_860209 [Mycena maculata]|uniref:Uncharacterized protein n=1 Tax=Mycena maculata TaxID=230809 RepID=A0AAD7HF03_9AGAR|nr:hypothetical protein DFH07DRAFT_860209 [Mycena maculata]